MKIVVLGGTGMLGHKMFQTLRERFAETYVWDRESPERLRGIELFKDHTIYGLNAENIASVKAILEKERPDFLINCVGVIKQRSEAHAFIPSLTINSLFPHQLIEVVSAWNGRLIHFSTDCVFSGKRGHYLETDPSDAEDLYGK